MTALVVKGRMLTKHFSKAEISCRCRRLECDAVPMRDSFLDKLEVLREAWGRPILVTSAQRCVVWNKAKGGVIDSQHLIGNAIDFHLDETKDLEELALLAEKYGFGGIGSGKHLLHIDDRGYKARWTYHDA